MEKSKDHHMCSALMEKFGGKIYSLDNESLSRGLVNKNDDDEESEVLTSYVIVSSDISTSTEEEQHAPTMGNQTPTIKVKSKKSTELTDSQIDLLTKSTKFSVHQIRDWHQSFIQECPSGKLDRKRFIEVYQQFYPQGKANKFCSLAFNAFDRDHSGFVDFSEFLTAIALTMSVEPKDRLDLAFTVYDTNGDGRLGKKELSCILKLISEVHGHKNVKQDMSPTRQARFIIDLFDLDGDGKLSREEFVQGCLNDTTIRNLLIL